MYLKVNGKLIPKSIGPFHYTFHFDEEGAKFDSGITFDSSAANAVIRHQINGFPTAGISTTPHFLRAKHYATSGGVGLGRVFKIDRSLLNKYGVKEFVVTHYATWPCVPEDDEIILVAANYGALPDGIVVETIPVVQKD